MGQVRYRIQALDTDNPVVVQVQVIQLCRHGLLQHFQGGEEVLSGDKSLDTNTVQWNQYNGALHQTRLSTDRALLKLGQIRNVPQS